MTARKENPLKRGAKKKTVEERLGAITFDLKKVMRIARFSCTDAQLGQILGVDERTINRWKNESPEFLSALKEAKNAADAKVERSLYERALGYKHRSVKIFCNKDGMVTEAPFIQRYAPDPIACIFWLKNRQPERWRDKQDVEVTEGVKVIRDDV